MLAFPTETFYGLGCCADQALAVARVYQAKRRPVHMPLPLLAGSLDLLRPYVTLEQAPEALLAAFWPGPLTVVLAARLTPLEGRRPLAPQLVNPRGKAAASAGGASLLSGRGAAHGQQRQHQRTGGRPRA